MYSIIHYFLLAFLLVQGKANAQQKEFIVKDYTGPITIDVIESLKNAETLQIINSSITQYPTRIFSRLPNIKKVVVIRSKFNIMDPTIYEDSSQLQSILFAENDVPELPLSLLRKTTFEKIVIADQSQVGVIPENFANETKNLKNFECSICSIKNIEEGAFNKLNILETLNLRINFIRELSPNVLAPLVNLKHLDLSENHLESFSVDQIKLNSNLESIDLHKNPLKELDLLDVLKVTPKLKQIDVRGTKLSKSQLKELMNNLSTVEVLTD